MSILRYGLIIWGNGVNINRAFIAQKKCVRAICRIGPRESCRPWFVKLQLLTLPCLYIFEICTFVKTNKHLFNTVQEVYGNIFRYPNRLAFGHNPRTALYQKNCNAMCIKIYNSIPNHIEELPNKHFKTKLFRWLVEKNFYDINEIFKK